MKRITQLATVVWLLVWSVSAVPPVAAQSALPETGFDIGKPFPTVALPSLEDGRPMSIADYRGQKVILHIFASW